MTTRWVAIAAVVAGALSCGGPGARGGVALLAPPRASGDMISLVERYQADRAALERAHNAPFSDRRRERLSKFYADWERTLAAVDFGTLIQDGKVDYLLLKNQIRHDREALDRKSNVDEAARALLPFSGIVTELEEKRRAFEAVDSEQAAGRLVELARKVKEARKDVGSPDRPAAHRAAEWTDRLR